MPQRAAPRAVPKFGMVAVVINGITHYRQELDVPAYGRSYILNTRDGVIRGMKLNMWARLPPWRLAGKTFVPDYLLADVAMELGYDVEDVLGLMSGRAYNWKS